MKQVTSSLIILLFICPILSLNAPSNAEDITTLSDGLPATDVMFYKAGENNSLSFKVPRDRMVANISLDLRGVSWENPDEKEMVVEYSHEWNNKAWSGTFDGNMMGSPLQHGGTRCRHRVHVDILVRRQLDHKGLQ
jgi:hypothetical protein